MKNLFKSILENLDYTEFLKQITEYILSELAKANNGNKAAATRVSVAQHALRNRTKEHQRARRPASDNFLE